MTRSSLCFDWARHGLVGPPANLPIPGGPQTVAEVLQPMLDADPNADGLVDSTRRLSWRELDAAVNQATHALVALGVGRFDRVGASLPNEADIVIAFLATMRVGAIWVGVNRQLAGPEKQEILDRAGCQVFVATSEVVAQLDGVPVPRPEQLLAVEDWRRLVSAQRTTPADTDDIDPFAPAAIAYTSGTTGIPKGAVHSQHNLLVYGATAREANLCGPNLHAGVQLPLTILNLFVIQVLHAFQNNGKCVCLNVKNAREFAQVVRDERIVHIASVPTIYHDFLKDPAVEPGDFSSVRLAEIGGTNVPTELLHEFKQRFGILPRVSYGMTEGPASVTRMQDGETPGAGAVGTPLPQIAVSIHDEAGRVLPPGREGEIWVGPSDCGPMAGIYTPILGYWNDPESTRAALRDGRYRTGDIGVLDESGRLSISGRRSDLIIRGGSNVHATEVERVLDRIAGVQASAVLGLPDERLGERIVAVIEQDPGTMTNPQKIREECAAQLARYKVPEQIVFTDRLPRNTMQKIVKSQLGALFD